MMRAPKLPPSANALAGPLLIVLAVVVVLHDFVFGGKFTNLNPDVPTVFLLNHCYLGESLRAGDIPLWNPYPMTGTPFAADPQSGWMYLPPMILYTAFSCGVAIRAFIVLQPIMAGLGLYWLLREEKLSRVAATSGGLVIALAMCASKVLVTIPFSDTLAWTALLLPMTGRCLRARTWPGRILWITATAVAWGQLAAAHLSHGLVMGTTAMLFYGVLVARRERREGRLASRSLVGVVGLLVVALPAVNLAHLLPVADYLQRATLGRGYDELQRLAGELRGARVTEPGVSRALGVSWPLRFATAPGLYLGAIPLMLMSAGLVSRRTRSLALTFAVYGVLFYVAGMKAVIGWVGPRIADLPFADFYRHSSGRFLYAVILAAVVVSAIGIDAWRDARSTRERVLMIAPGLLVWGALPLIAGAFPTRMALFGLGVIAGGVALVAVARRPALAWVIPVILLFELGAGAIVGQAAGYRLAKDGLETDTDSWIPFRPLPEPTINARHYIAGGTVENAARGQPDDGRLLVLGEGLTWMLRPLLSHVEMPQGYNPVQLPRYWAYVRSIVAQQLRYNMSIFPKEIPPVEARNLLQVGWVATDEPPLELGLSKVTGDDKHDLYRIESPPPRASVFTSVRGVGSAEDARAVVTDRSFDPTRAVIVERPGDVFGLSAENEPGDAIFEWTSPNRAVVQVDAAGSGVLLIRNAWDSGWSASVDGRETDVFSADYFLQGVDVPGGEHTVVLTYSDPNIKKGLIGTELSLVVLLAMAAISRFGGTRVQP